MEIGATGATRGNLRSGRHPEQGRPRRWRAKLVAALAVVPVAGASAFAFGLPETMTARAASATINAFTIPTAGSNSQTIRNGPDGNLWFVEASGNNIGRITTAGVITEFPIPTANSSASDVVTGPDGNLWFTEYSPSQIGRITPAGKITEFPLPSGGNPNGIAAGADGNLWFTEFNGNQIGRITTAGVITEFSIPTGGSKPIFIAPGPDGNLWFTEYNANQIGRITPTGTITEFAASSGSNPYGIVAGPDGNIWFTEITSNKIAEMSTAGTGLTEYPTPTSFSAPTGITVGPGGLWFTEFGTGIVGQISTTGSIQEFSAPSGSVPFWPAFGPDGDIWFTDTSSSNNSVDQLVSPACNVVGNAASQSVVVSGTETISITVTSCGPALNNAVTTSTTAVPSGCPAAPAIPTFTDSLASDVSTVHTSTFGPPSCPGTYTVTSQTTVGGTIVGSATTTYRTPTPGDGFLFPTPCCTRPGYMTSGSDGNLWFTDGSSNLGQVTPSGGITYSQSAVQGEAQQLTTGSEGDLYVNAFVAGGSATESDIANVKPGGFNGTTFKWEVSAKGTSINDLALGPDGNVWFAGHPSVGTGGTVGFVTPAGKVKLFQLPPADGVPVAITSGPDGALWFLLTIGQIGRISTTGTVTLFIPPTATSFGGSNTIALGPDGNLWFLGADSNSNDIVGRVAPTGAVTEFAALQPRAEETGITAAADGNLWFNQPELTSCGYGSGVGRITPSGVLTDLFASCVDTNDRWNIVAGPDGNVWNSAYYGIGVARIVTGAPSTCTPLNVTGSPASVAHGGQETISSVMHNCATTPQLMKLERKTIPPSTCGSPSTTHVNVPLQPRVQTTVTSSFAAPKCKGTYTVKNILSAGGTVVGASTVTYQVT